MERTHPVVFMRLYGEIAKERDRDREIDTALSAMCSTCMYDHLIYYFVCVLTMKG